MFTGKLTNPSYTATAPEYGQEGATAVQSSGLLGQSTLQVLKRTGSTTSLTSLTSLIDPYTGEDHIRVCSYCKQVSFS